MASDDDPNVQRATGEFALPNGDMYAGEYCAHRCGLIWREGHGVYTTQDGQVYEGEWKDDKLAEGKELVIRYPTGDTYRGPLVRDKYAGGGTYTLENTMDVSCVFADNKPVGNVVLVDINGRIWEGQAEANRALLLPENQFYSSIPEELGVGNLKMKYLQMETGEPALKEEKSIQMDDKEMEKIVFARSLKTAIDHDFTKSKWYQRYERYKIMKSVVTEKLMTKDTEGYDLTEEEAKWYRKYKKHQWELKDRQKKGVVEKNACLLDQFHSKEFQESCPPLKIFYPSRTETEGLAEGKDEKSL